MPQHLAPFALRDYQEEAITKTLAAAERGVRSQLGVAATGLGKTVIFVALAKRMDGRTLILAHRDELVSQAAQKVRDLWPEVDVGIVKAGDNECRAQVVVASVQTLARERRLDELIATTEHAEGLAAWGGYQAEPFSLVVVDEAHHAAADSYRLILDALGAGTPEGPVLLGVTATPDRGDGQGLDDLFDEIVWNYDILWGIRSGYLCDVRALQVKVDVDVSKLKVRGGDYEAGASGRAMHEAKAHDRIYAAWVQHASDRRTLIFTPTVETAEDCVRTFADHGASVAIVSAKTPLEDRRHILRAFHDGAIQVVANCAVLTEGFDEPRVDCVVMARPTKSRALFTQIVGRGTRKHPDKEDCLVLDVVAASNELSLVTVPSLFGIDGAKFRPRMTDGTGLLTDVVQEYDDHQVKVGRMKAEDADLFRKMRAAGGVAWIALHKDGERRKYQRTMNKRGGDGSIVPLPTMILAEIGPDVWLCGMIDVDGKKRVLMRDVDLETAQAIGEDTIRKLGGMSQLTNADAPWRKKRPSNKALAAARKWNLKDLGKYKTAGDLSDALDAHIGRVREKNRAKGH